MALPSAATLRKHGLSEDRIDSYRSNKINFLQSQGLSLKRSTEYVDAQMGIVPDSPKSYKTHTSSNLKVRGINVPGPVIQAQELGGGYKTVRPEEYQSYVTQQVVGAIGEGRKDAAEVWSAYKKGEIQLSQIQDKLDIPGLQGLIRPKSTINYTSGNEDPFENIIINDFSTEDAMRLGYQQSVTGLIMRGRLPDIEIPNKMGMVDRLMMGAAQMVGDTPTFLVGSIIGGGTTGNPVTAAGGGFALTEGYRKFLTDKYERGEIKDFEEFWTRTKATVDTTVKSWNVGALTAGTGPAVNKILTKQLNRMGVQGNVTDLSIKSAALASEVAVMTTAGAALEGEIPSFQEFIDGAALVGLMKMGNFYRKKFYDIYNDRGRRPIEVLRDSRIDITMREDLASTNTSIPRSYGGGPDKSQKPVKPAPPEMTITEAIRKVERSISRGDKVSDAIKNISPRESFNRFYTRLVDQNHPLHYRAGVKPGQTTQSMQEMRTLGGREAARADAWLRTGRETGKTFQEIIQPLGRDAQEFGIYAAAVRSNNLRDRGIKVTGLNKEATRKIEFELKPKYDKKLKELNKYHNDLLREMRDNGLISKELYKKIKSVNENYIPFARIMEVVRETGGRSRTDVMTAVREIVGGTQKIMDPLEAVIQNTYRTISMIERNNTVKTVARQFGNKVGETKPKTVGQFFNKAGEPVKGNSLFVWEDGKRVEYKVDKSIADVINRIDYNSWAITRLAGTPTRWLRAGAILTPEFMLRNPIRDQFTASIYSRYGYVFGYDMLRGLTSMFKNDKYYKEYIESGAANSYFVSWDRRYMQGQLRDLYKLPVRNRVNNEIDMKALIDRMKIWNRPQPGRTILSAINPISKLQYLSELSEIGTRVGEFRRGRESGAPLREVSIAAREVTQDFRRIGSMTKGLNLLSAFANANIQGIDRFARAMRENPQQTLANAFFGITVPSLLLGMVRNDIISNDPDSDMAIALREIPAWQKDLFWIIPGPDDIIYRIPKPFEVGILFGSSAERYVDYLFENDNDSKNLLKYMQDEGFLDTLSESMMVQIMPNIARPFVEAYANRDSFTDQPIIPAYLEKILPELQYSPESSEVAKNLAKAIHWTLGTVNMEDTPYITSPLQIDNLVREWTGGLGKHVVDVIDSIAERTGVFPGKPYAEPAKVLSDMPVIKAFVVRYPTAGTRSIKEFYDNIEQAEIKYNSILYLSKTNLEAGKLEELLTDGGIYRLQGMKQSMGTMFALIRSLTIDPAMNPQEKRQMIEDTYMQLISVAREGVRIMRKLDEIPNPETVRPNTP